LALCLVLVAPAKLYAQTVHEVRLGRLAFLPDMLTIEAGDTVRWLNKKGGVKHDVVSYDNAWQPSILASEFIFEVTFPRLGEFRYFCTPHENYGMTGTITVVENVPDPEFFINAGHAGAWFNPDTSGQGQFIDVEPEEQFMFISWFTYTDAASAHPFEQRWLTAQGSYNGNTAQLDLFETLGGKFDDPQAVTTAQVGDVTLSFSDCGQGQMTYSLDEEDLEGEFTLIRVIGGSENVCEQLSGNAAQAVGINAGMDGAWFDSNTPGQGFFIDAHPDPQGGNLIFVSWFTFGDETASGQRWLTAQGSFEGSTAEIDVFETTGGSFDDPTPVNTTKVGTMSLDFTDCSNAQLTYSLPAESAAGDIAITRVLPGGKALCEELAGPD
jgi:plastocyanin